MSEDPAETKREATISWCSHLSAEPMPRSTEEEWLWSRDADKRGRFMVTMAPSLPLILISTPSKPTQKPYYQAEHAACFSLNTVAFIPKRVSEDRADICQPLQPFISSSLDLNSINRAFTRHWKCFTTSRCAIIIAGHTWEISRLQRMLITLWLKAKDPLVLALRLDKFQINPRLLYGEKHYVRGYCQYNLSRFHCRIKLSCFCEDRDLK